MRANFLPSHSPHTLAPSFFRQKAYCLLMILWMGVRFNRQGANKAAVYRECRYAALLVAGMLPLLCRYAAPLVFLCWTDSIPMLDQQFSYAGPLVPECFTFLVLLFLFVYKQYQGEFRFFILHWLSLRPPNVVSSFFILIVPWLGKRNLRRILVVRASVRGESLPSHLPSPLKPR